MKRAGAIRRGSQPPSTADRSNGDARWLADLLRAMRGRRIAVVGDLMLDEWLWGRVRRISPEAPVPVVEVEDHSYTLGGAGNVANNLAALGARVIVVGVAGRDEAAARLFKLFSQLGVDAGAVVQVADRPTTQKTRIVAHHQQVVRADREATKALDERTRGLLERKLAALDGAVDGIVLSDYGKGLIGAPLVARAARFKQRVVVTADPKPRNIDAFVGVDCIAPNAAEAAAACGMDADEPDLAAAAAQLMRRTRCRYVIVTQGERGMTLYRRGARPFSVPAVARQVYDVSGAGDTVMSILTLALSVGAPIETAMAAANVAAGVVVGKLGTATASPRELLHFAATEEVVHPPFSADGKRSAHGGRR